jgi:hypothetical protein
MKGRSAADDQRSTERLQRDAAEKDRFDQLAVPMKSHFHLQIGGHRWWAVRVQHDNPTSLAQVNLDVLGLQPWAESEWETLERYVETSAWAATPMKMC